MYTLWRTFRESRPVEIRSRSDPLRSLPAHVPAIPEEEQGTCGFCDDATCIQQHPFPEFAGLITLVAVTLIYAVNAATVYWMLYGRKSNPFETHAGCLHTIGLAVKSSVYSCIVIVVYLSFMGYAAPLRKPELDARNLAASGWAAIYAPGQRDIGPVDRLTLQSKVTGLTGPLRDHNDKVAAERCGLVLQIVACAGLEIRVRCVLSGEGIALTSSHVTEPLAIAARFHVGDADQLGARFQRDCSTTRQETQRKNSGPFHVVLLAQSAGRF
jgi:hypothetical protein